MDDASGGHEPSGVSGLRSDEPAGERTFIVGSKRPLIQWAAQLGAVIVGIVIVVVVLQLVYGGGVDHESLDARLVRLEQEARFQSCLLQFVPEERSERVIATCQLPPSSTVGS